MGDAEIFDYDQDSEDEEQAKPILVGSLAWTYDKEKFEPEPCKSKTLSDEVSTRGPTGSSIPISRL